LQIFLVEDDADLIETIQLGWPDHQDHIEAFKDFASFKPVLFSGGLSAADCVILDMKLPDASGTQIIAEIRRLSDIPIIVLSGWGETEWFLSCHTLLDGRQPAEVLRADPARVLAVAREEFSEGPGLTR